MAQNTDLVLLAVDECEHSEKAFDCEYKHWIVFYLFRWCGLGLVFLNLMTASHETSFSLMSCLLFHEPGIIKNTQGIQPWTKSANLIEHDKPFTFCDQERTPKKYRHIDDETEILTNTIPPREFETDFHLQCFFPDASAIFLLFISDGQNIVCLPLIFTQLGTVLQSHPRFITRKVIFSFFVLNFFLFLHP